MNVNLTDKERFYKMIEVIKYKDKKVYLFLL